MPIARTVPFLYSAAVVLAGAVHRLRAVFVVQMCNFPDILQEPDGFFGSTAPQAKIPEPADFNDPEENRDKDPP